MLEQLEIITAEPLDNGQIIVTFNTNEKRLFDITELEGPAFKPLRNDEIFKSVKVTDCFISWDSGNIDCAPEYIYENGYDYDDDTKCEGSLNQKSLMQKLIATNLKRNEKDQTRLMYMNNIPIEQICKYMFTLTPTEVEEICKVTKEQISNQHTHKFI